MRPHFGIALGGGGARGLAHIGVMQSHLTQRRLAVAMPDVILPVELPDIGLETVWKGSSAIETVRLTAEKYLPKIQARCQITR